MKIFSRVSIIALIVAVAFGFMGTTNAATTVSLGNADGFAILAGTGITIGGAVNTSNITGDIGSYSTPTIIGIGNAVLTGTNHAGDATTQAGKTSLGTAYTNAEGQTLPSVTPVVASTIDSFSGTGYTLAPGIYNSGSDMGITGTLTLNGSATDVWIFQAGSTLTTAGASVINLTGGAQACNVFWQVGSSATLGSGSTFKGNILALTSIGLGTTANVEGRVLAQNGAVTLDGSNTITKATCASVPSTSSTGGSRRDGTINVVKTVINDNGGTKTVNDFPLFINGVSVLSGITNIFQPADGYVVSETVDPRYTQTFSGDCDSTGRLNIGSGMNKFCIITNNDIGVPVAVPPVAPLIDVVKVPSPLALPSGAGSVSYTYTLRNIGTVPVTDITMVGDTCRPINLISGDVNADGKLGVNETWTYRCVTNLSETHTNTVVATGWANGLSATDIASATVVVGTSLVPPLIHVTKVPSPLKLPMGGGLVTYTKKVTNPGTVALNNIRLTDDKCDLVKYVSGDVNKDSKLDTSETWIYTCQARLDKTTTNTVVVSGDANGMTARDFAIATVVVASAPKLPNTGISPDGNASWNVIIPVGLVSILLFSYIARKKKLV